MKRTPWLGVALVLATSCGLLTPLGAQRLPTATPEGVGLSSERLERIGDAFQGYVDEGRIAGAVGMIVRNGRVAYVGSWGMRDIAAGDPMEDTDLFRICSMTKPITSVAAMMLWEEGHFSLTDPIGRYLPELANLPVADLEAATDEDVPTVRARRPPTIQDLLRHTSGLTYGSFSNTAVDRMYRDAGILEEATLEEMVEHLAQIPLAYHPGARWNYSVSADVLGRLIEVVSGRSLEDFMAERIFGPLGMKDTGFSVPASQMDRFAATYTRSGPDGPLMPGRTFACLKPDGFFAGGSGLVSTADDYARFAQMLLNGGSLDGVQILGKKTVELMTADHLGDAEYGGRRNGQSWGLGFNIKTHAGLDGMPDSPGSFNWVGIQGTGFWVDPVENLIGVFMVQISARDIPFRDQFKRLVYQAVVR